MPYFSKVSLERRATIHPDLQKIVDIAIKIYDFAIVCGYRDKEAQDEAYQKGKSKVAWPTSKHNVEPSRAVDLAPYNTGAQEINWTNTDNFFYLGGLVKGVAAALDIPLIWGGDFNNNGIFTDQNFHDLGHFELA